MLLRVRGSAWELNIDTKRFQEQENNDFEEGSQRSHEQKAINIARRGPEKKFLSYKVFENFFLRREGVRGDLAQAVPGGSAELRRQPLA